MPNDEYVVNENIDTFLISNGIDPNVIKKSDKLGNILTNDINTIINNYKIVDKRDIKKDVCVRDIVGLEPIRCRGKYSLIDVLNETYATNTSRTYAIRDNDKLRLPKDEMIKSIKSSINREEICLDYVDDGKYVVSTNGCHRTSILRLLYIAETFGKTDEEKQLIDEKYTINCRIKTYDYDVTYIHFILNYFDIVKEIFRDLDEHYEYCDRYIVKDNDGNKTFYTKEQLINFFLEFVNSEKFMNNQWALQMLIINAKRYQSLYEFIDKYIPNLIPMIEKDEENETRRN